MKAKNKLREAGFSVVEGLLVLVVVGALGVVGYMALSRSNPSTTATTSESTKDLVAPDVKTASDLTTAEQTLDSSELDAADTELNAELESF